MWLNTATTLEQLHAAYALVVPVHPTSMTLVQQLATTDATVCTCIERIVECMDMTAMHAPGGGGAPESTADEDASIDSAFEYEIPTQAAHATRSLLMYGFVVYKSVRRSVSRDGSAPPMEIPIVQDVSMYRAFVCVTEDGDATVVAIPKENAGQRATMLPGPLAAEEGGQRSVQPMQTHTWKVPETTAGRLTSPVASLIAGWTEVLMTQAARARAVVAGAIPVQVYQHQEPRSSAAGGGGNPIETQLAGHMNALMALTHEPTDGVIPETPAMLHEQRETALSEAAKQAEQSAQAALTPLEQYLSNPDRILGAGVVMRLPPARATIPVPPGMQYAGTVTAPSVPADALALSQTFRISVGARMGIPLGILGLSPASRATTTVTEHEMQWFITNMASYSQMLSRAVEQMFEYATGRVTRVHIPLRTPLRLDTLFSMYEALLIDRNQLSREVERSYGIVRGDSGSKLPFSARNAGGPVVRRPVYGKAGARLQPPPSEVAPTVFSTKRPRKAQREPPEAAEGGKQPPRKRQALGASKSASSSASASASASAAVADATDEAEADDEEVAEVRAEEEAAGEEDAEADAEEEEEEEEEEETHARFPEWR